MDETAELASINIKEYIFWLFAWKWVGIALSVIYIWWFMIWHKHSIGEAILLTAVVAILGYGLTQNIRNLLPTIIHLGTADCYHGTITFTAILLRVHFETLIVLSVGILLGLGALGVIVQEIIKAFIERRETPDWHTTS